MSRKTDELNRLYERLYELDKESQRNKLIRPILSMLLFVATNMVILYVTTKPHTIDAFIFCIVVSLVWGIFSHWICFEIFLYHFVKCQEENSNIKYVADRISELEKTDESDDDDLLDFDV